MRELFLTARAARGLSDTLLSRVPARGVTGGQQGQLWDAGHSWALSVTGIIQADHRGRGQIIYTEAEKEAVWLLIDNCFKVWVWARQAARASFPLWKAVFWWK